MNHKFQHAKFCYKTVMKLSKWHLCLHVFLFLSSRALIKLWIAEVSLMVEVGRASE